MKFGLSARISAAVVLTVPFTVASYSQETVAHSAQHSSVTKAQVDGWMTTQSNWGRWGKDDQLGTLNLITQAKREQAMALAKMGIVVSLEKPIVLGPEVPESKADGLPHGIYFYQITFNTFGPDDPQHNNGFSSDLQTFHVHGPATHLDALCHDSSNGKLYNGYPLTATVDHFKGCKKDSVDNLKNGIVTRGILIDMTRLRGASPGSRVYVKDIEAWERQTGLKFSPGDAIFLYNPRKSDGQRQGGSAVFDLAIVPWLKARGISVVTGGVSPAADDIHADHRVILAGLGAWLLDGVDTEKLAETAARLHRWEFMFVVAPIPVPGATGSMVNPLAMF